ncbi:MAG: radical SAM protein [Rheinheimera sp.]|nr:radical SAM protein [Rheinheimera sp.]
MISRDTSKADRYLDNLAVEMRSYQDATRHQTVRQLHFGGGTPTFLDENQLLRLMDLLHQHFHFAEDAELSIEIDPRSCSLEKLRLLRNLGFSRVSFGVQDFDPSVQEAIHRVQSVELVESLVNEARRLGFTSVNLDLVYGLPHQHPASFANTLQEVVRTRS